jgi:hypothetical protein
MIAGESKQPNEVHLLKLATHFKVKNAGNILDEVKASINNWRNHVATNGVRRLSKNTIGKVISP